MEYVLVFAQPTPKKDDEILVIEKNRPLEQLRKINLCGGKIEPNETPEQASIRELKEESGFSILAGTLPVVMGKIQGNFGVAHCVKILINKGVVNPRDEETERVFWYSWNYLRQDNRLMSNLKVVIPLVLAGVTDWTITDNNSITDEKHKIEIII